MIEVDVTVPYSTGRRREASRWDSPFRSHQTTSSEAETSMIAATQNAPWQSWLCPETLSKAIDDVAFMHICTSVSRQPRMTGYAKGISSSSQLLLIFFLLRGPTLTPLP